MPIGTSKACQSYISDYIQTNGPRKEFDDGLTRYCTKYNGFGDLFSSNQTDQDLCGCHMPEDQYKTFATELSQNYTGFENIFIDQCLVPGCINSPYKSNITTKTCPLPACLNIVNFNNQGNFNNSGVNIIQDNSQCANIKSKNIPPPPKPSNLTWLWITIGVIVGLIILAIVIGLLVYYSRKKKTAIILEKAPVYKVEAS